MYLLSFATPTTSQSPSGSEGILNRRPMGSRFGHSLAASVSLTMATRFEVAVSWVVKLRPCTMGRRIMSKYVALTLLQPTGDSG